MLPHLATRLYNTPLLIQRAKLDAILTVLGNRVGWNGPLALVPTPAVRSLPEAMPGIALIPVYGSLVRRSLGVEAASGLTAYTDINRQIDQALADPRIEGILLDIDSPGGEAGGVFELGERIRLADAVKPVWAMADDSAFSAAYVLASGASRVFVSRTGGVGSIGVIALHVDQSLHDAQAGVRYTAIYAGEHKNDFSPHAPLTDAAASRLQAEVDRLYGLFVGHVAAMRGLDEDEIRATEAGLFFGPEAVDAGLADAEGSPEAVLGELVDFLTARCAPALTARSMTASTPLLQEKSPMNHLEQESVRDEPPLVLPIEPEDTPESPGAPEADSAETIEKQVQAAVTAARADAVNIAELCQLAGHPERIADFLAEGASEAQVRHALLAMRAERPEIASRIHPDIAVSLQSTTTNPVVAAVKKLIGKE